MTDTPKTAEQMRDAAAQVAYTHFPATQDMGSTMICVALAEVARAIRAIPCAEPDVLDDTSLRAKIGEVGNQVHNIACEMHGQYKLRDRLEAIRSDLWRLAQAASAEPDVQVRPLTWYGKPEGQKVRIGRCGETSYSVSFNDGRWGYQRRGHRGHVVSLRGGAYFKTEADAIDGADADHERRIRECLK